MIVIGLDVHKQSVTAVAVDEAGRPLTEKVVGSAATSCSAGRRRLTPSGCGRLRIAAS
jgi:hypothetical protein